MEFKKRQLLANTERNCLVCKEHQSAHGHIIKLSTET
jgi:hypothetical protein